MNAPWPAGGSGPDETVDAALRTVHVDEHLIVIDKPAGLLSVPGRGVEKADCAAVRVQARWGDALVVHRLDMATSGLLLFARGASMQRRLSMAFERREVEKCYVAVVAGLVEGESGDIDAPLGADWPRRPLQQIDAAHGRPSLTRYRVIERDAALSRTRLALEPLTGRSHQLRVHLAHIGHPIVGDELYAPPHIAQAARRLLLHASTLALLHPFTDEPMRFVSDATF